MSSLSEAATHRTTLGMLADRYGYELSPKFSRAVTVTSLASDIDSVTAGSLFMPATHRCRQWRPPHGKAPMR